MWGFQEHFRISRQIQAEQLFQRLAPDFVTEVFLVGVVEDESAERHPVCIEPEEDFWLRPDSLDGVVDHAKKLASDFPESQVFQTHPQAAANHVKSIRLKAMKLSVDQKINQCKAKPDGMIYYSSAPVLMNGYSVFTVLGLRQSDLDAYPRLQSDSFSLHSHRSISIPRSLLDAVIETFLAESVTELAGPIPGEDLFAGNNQRILEDSAKRMVSGIAARCDSFENFDCAYQAAFDNFAEIASLEYERVEPKGQIILARRNHPAVRSRIDFLNPVPLSNARHVRKLLEMTRDTPFALHTNSKEVWGLIEIDRGNDSLESEDLFEVRFSDKYLWQCDYAGRVLLQVENGTPRLVQPTVDASALTNDISRLFPSISDANIERYIELIRAATTQSHGTMVVISENADNEARRLSKQSTPIVPTEVDSELVHAITSIDGAVLLGGDGNCYAVGVILDGIATDAGDSARGARFNSAIRYLATREEICMAIIVSEDGGINVYPSLRKAIPRHEIDSRLDELRTVANSEKIPRRYLDIVNWFDSHKFYLLEADCDVLNVLIPEIEQRRIDEDNLQVTFTRSAWSPHPEMREDWYYVNYTQP